jgi:predicted CopG family antitoxin
MIDATTITPEQILASINSIADDIYRRAYELPSLKPGEKSLLDILWKEYTEKRIAPDRFALMRELLLRETAELGHDRRGVTI